MKWYEHTLGGSCCVHGDGCSHPHRCKGMVVDVSLLSVLSCLQLIPGGWVGACWEQVYKNTTGFALTAAVR